jgi:hypothetical protein
MIREIFTRKHGGVQAGKRQRRSAAPLGLIHFGNAFPALTRWATLFRRCAAGVVSYASRPRAPRLTPVAWNLGHRALSVLMPTFVCNLQSLGMLPIMLQMQAYPLSSRILVVAVLVFFIGVSAFGIWNPVKLGDWMWHFYPPHVQRLIRPRPWVDRVLWSAFALFWIYVLYELLFGR